MKLTIYGGAGAVTGAHYVLRSGTFAIAIDCGLEQGGMFCEEHNWDPFPYPLSDLSAVFVTHAHIDHTGKLPKLVKDGYRGPIYATPPTRDSAELFRGD